MTRSYNLIETVLEGNGLVREQEEEEMSFNYFF